MKKSGASEEYVLSEEQLKKLWSVCSEPKDRMLVGLLGFCGLRIGEARHLHLNWIKEGEIHIPSSMPCQCNECWNRGHWRPKSQAGIRVIPVPKFLKPVLLDFLTKFPDGLKMTRQAGWYRIQRLADKAGLSHVFPHSLRATAATLLASKGFTAVELCAYFGWARISMGEHYIRIGEAKEGVRRKMKEIWG